jgi:hypothetical protein
MVSWSICGKVIVSKKPKESEETSRVEGDWEKEEGEGEFRTYISTNVDSRIVRAANTATATALLEGGSEAIEVFDTLINCNGASEVPILACNRDTKGREFLFSPSKLATSRYSGRKVKVNSPCYASSTQRRPQSVTWAQSQGGEPWAWPKLPVLQLISIFLATKYEE